MIDDLYEQLDEQLERFLQLWAEQLVATQQAGCVMERSNAIYAYHHLLSALNGDGEPPAAGQTFFTELATRQINNGLPLSQILLTIKTMRQVLMQLIDEVIIAERIKCRAHQRLLCFTDHLEQRLLNSWQHHDSDQLTRNLQQRSQQLQREKNSYRHIFDSTSNLVLLTDSDGTIVELNPQARIFFSGRSPLGSFCGQLLGSNARSLPQLLEELPPSEIHEITLQRDQHQHVFNLQLSPLERDALAQSGLMLLLSDITCMVDHRQALAQRVSERTRALANSEKMLDAIFQSVGKGILLIDSDREIVKANQQSSEIFGIPPEVLVGTPFCNLTDPEGCRKLCESSEQLLEGQRLQMEVTGLYVDGKTFPCEVTMTRMDLDGRPFWPVIVRDITEQRALEDGLREEKMQSEEMNVTLRNVLKSIESDRQEVEQNLTHRIRSSLLPGLEKIRSEAQADIRASYLDLIRQQLIALTAGFETELDADLLKLSKTELKICRFVKAGLTGKEICDTMNLSFETIQTHRKNIRRKLGLQGKNINLHTFLANRSCDLGGLEGD